MQVPAEADENQAAAAEVVGLIVAVLRATGSRATTRSTRSGRSGRRCTASCRWSARAASGSPIALDESYERLMAMLDCGG